MLIFKQYNKLNKTYYRLLSYQTDKIMIKQEVYYPVTNNQSNYPTNYVSNYNNNYHKNGQNKQGNGSINGKQQGKSQSIINMMNEDLKDKEKASNKAKVQENKKVKGQKQQNQQDKNNKIRRLSHAPNYSSSTKNKGTLINTNAKNATMKRIQKLYTQIPSTQSISNYNNQGLNTISSNPYNKFTIKSITTNTNQHKNGSIIITKQQLYEQNIKLKNTINELRSELNKQKVQTQLQKKKNKKYTKKLGREFRKDFYYSHINNSKDDELGYEEVQDANRSIENVQEQDYANNEYASFKNINLNLKNIQQKPSDSQQQGRCLTEHKKSSLAKINQYNNSYEKAYEEMIGKKYSINIIPTANNIQNNHNNSPTGHRSQTKNISNSKYNSNVNGNFNMSMKTHSNQYLIAGIKEKYQELKLQNEKLKAQLDKVKQVDGYKKLEQVSIYVGALEESNKKLAQGLQICKTKLQSYEKSKDGNRDQQLYKEGILKQLNDKVQRLKQKNNALKVENKKLRFKNKQSSKTIQYLESLVISNENVQLRAINTAKKLNVHLETLNKQLQDQRESNKLMKVSYMKQLQSLSAKYQKQRDMDRNLFEQALIERNLVIKKLQKQVKYLTTIVEHWKPTNQQGVEQSGTSRDKSKHTKRNSSATLKNKQFQFNSEQVNKGIEEIVERKQLQKQYEKKINQIAGLNNRIALGVDQVEYSRNNFKRTQIIQRLQKINLQTERKRKTAAIKANENTKKLRKVTIQQILQLAQHIRYRLIGSNVNIDQACSLFDYLPHEKEEENKIRDSVQSAVSISSSLEQLSQSQRWKILYINLSQVKSILLQEPFRLQPQDALILSRYIVQDECFYENGDNNNVFVYFDEGNEIQRAIAKSIIRAFIKTHSSNLIEASENNSEKYQKEWMQIMEKNGNRLHIALISIAPNGMISKDKWEDLLKSINVQISEDSKEWTIGKMLVQSSELRKLKYQTLMKHLKEN